MGLLRRIYLFEWIAVVSVAAMFLFLAVAPVSLAYFRLATATLRMMAAIAAVSVAVIFVATLPRLLRGWKAWWRGLATGELGRRRFWADVARIAVGFSLIQTAHLTLKVYIPLINSANYDPLLRTVDTWLCLGHDPLRVVLGLFGAPLSVRIMDFLYSSAYFVLLWGNVVVYLAALKGAKRIAFFNSFFVMWQVGLLMYVLLPSWGPVFVTPDLFEAHLQYCPFTTASQSVLVHETSSIIAGRYEITIHLFGLAAFPSLHVAVFTLFALWAHHLGRWLLFLNLACLGLILVGSMLVGYHYLVDGVAGALVAAFATVVGHRTSVTERGSSSQ